MESKSLGSHLVNYDCVEEIDIFTQHSLNWQFFTVMLQFKVKHVKLTMNFSSINIGGKPYHKFEGKKSPNNEVNTRDIKTLFFPLKLANVKTVILKIFYAQLRASKPQPTCSTSLYQLRIPPYLSLESFTTTHTIHTSDTTEIYLIQTFSSTFLWAAATFQQLNNKKIANSSHSFFCFGLHLHIWPKKIITLKTLRPRFFVVTIVIIIWTTYSSSWFELWTTY